MKLCAVKEMPMEGNLEKLKSIYGTIKFDVDSISNSKNSASLNFFDKGQVGVPPAARPGIYIFKTTKKTQLNPQVFDSVKYAAKTNKNFPNDGQVETGKYAYVGKSEDSVKKRLEEHIKQCPKTTYSLRLFDRKRKSLKSVCPLRFIILKTYMLTMQNLFCRRPKGLCLMRLNRSLDQKETDDV